MPMAHSASRDVSGLAVVAEQDTGDLPGRFQRGEVAGAAERDGLGAGDGREVGLAV